MPALSVIEVISVGKVCTGGFRPALPARWQQKYPGIDLWETNIDAQMMWLLKNPDQYGVRRVSITETSGEWRE